MSALESWENFFRSCDLPSNICRIYAKSFVKERIQPFMLNELGKEELKELGVTALGDQLSILRYLKSSKGILHDFDSTKSRSIVYNELKRQDGTLYSGQSEPKRVSEQSRVIRKKPVMIHDVSSSSTGSLRSDAMSFKKLIVKKNKPNFCVNYNAKNAYDHLIDEPLDEDNDYIELSQPKASKIITISNKKNSNVISQRNRLISNINQSSSLSSVRNIILSNNNCRVKTLASSLKNNASNNRSIQSRIQILKPKVSENIMDRISILKR